MGSGCLLSRKIKRPPRSPHLQSWDMSRSEPHHGPTEANRVACQGRLKPDPSAYNLNTNSHTKPKRIVFLICITFTLPIKESSSITLAKSVNPMAFKSLNIDLNQDMEQAEEDMRVRLNRTRGLVNEVAETRQQQRLPKQHVPTRLNIFPQTPVGKLGI